MQRGSMRRRGETAWELRVYRGIYPDTGRQRWATRTIHGGRRVARAQLAAFVEEIGHARIQAGTISELLERWFEAASPHWATSTVRQTRSVIDRHLAPRLGHLAVTKLTTVDIDDLYAHLLTAGGRDDRALTSGTVHRIHVVLHRALAQAVGVDLDQPGRQRHPTRLEPTEIRPPSPEQVATLLTSVCATDPALFTYLRLAVSTGARRSQLLALRWADIDIAEGEIGFTRALVEGPNGPQLRPTKTRRAYRVALDADTLAAVVDHHARVQQRADCADSAGMRECFVFSDDPAGTRPWPPNLVTKRFIRARRDPGSRTSGCTISATSWPPRCSPPAHRSPRSPSGSGTPEPPPPSTSTPTPVRGGDRDAAETLAKI